MNSKTILNGFALIILLLLQHVTGFSQQQHHTCKSRTTVFKICSGQYSNQTAACGPGTLETNMNPSCNTATLDITMIVANLAENPNSEETYQWPTGAHPIYIGYQYSPGVQNVTTSVQKFKYIGMQGTIPLFGGTKTVSVQAMENLQCEGDEHFVINVPTRILQKVNDVYDYYPVEDYADTGNLFDCNLFEETCYLCDPGCSKPERPIYNLKACIDCSSCWKKEKYPVGQNIQQQNPSQQIVSIHPNPFSNQLNYEFDAEQATEVTVTLLNTAGQELLQVESQFNKGTNAKQLDTGFIPNGVYLIVIETNYSRHVQKIIK